MDDYWMDFDDGMSAGGNDGHTLDPEPAPGFDVSVAPGGYGMPEPGGPDPEFRTDMSFDELNENLFRFEEELDNTEFVDTDGDGRLDSVVQTFDTDGDGAPDALSFQTNPGDYVVTEQDTDGDGYPDAAVVYEDADGDGVVDYVYTYEGAPAPAEPADAPDEWQYAAPEPADPLPPELDVPNFDPAAAGEAVVGEPASDMAHWHQQAYPDTCAVASQEFILDGLTGRDFSEDELRQQAIDNGWYTPGGGTTLEDMGKLLEANGVPVERQYNSTLDDLSARLEQGGKVLVAVDSDEVWSPGQDNDEGFFSLLTYPGIPGQDANHAVEVIGIDRSDPDNPMVVLNDPGHPDGGGMLVPESDFLNAWADSNNYMVSTL